LYLTKSVKIVLKINIDNKQCSKFTKFLYSGQITSFMIAIIGAGPIGCYLASLLAKNYKVYVFEEHKKIGKPVQCTGLLSSEIKNFVKLKKNFLVNEITDARVYSKNNFIDLKLKKNFLLNREKFDKYLAKKAEQAGAKIFLNSKFIGYKNKKILIKQNNKIKRFSFDFLIGADGVNSKVNEVFFKNKKTILIGLQARFKKKREKEEKGINFYVSEGIIAWVVFENENIARVGIIDKPEKAKESFKRFVKKQIGNNYKKNLIEYQSGAVPLYNPHAVIEKNFDGKKIFLIGDAAGQVKATSFGGIVQGLTAAKILKHSIVNKKSYHKGLKNINKELKLHVFLRKLMDSFSPKDYDFLIKLLKSRKNKKIIETYNRDNFSKIFLKLVFSDIRFFYFSKNLIKIFKLKKELINHNIYK